MTGPRGMSPAARRQQKSKTLVIGLLLVLLWVVGVLDAASSPTRDPSRTAAVLGVLFLLPGAIMTLVGGRAELAARRFNKLDKAFAVELASSFQTLCDADSFDAYRTDATMAEVRGARLVEVERHFDQRTLGNIAGSMTHQMSLFGGMLSTTYGRLGVGGLAGAVSGVSAVDVSLDQTTRDHLMGDALFAVLEAPGPAGPDDTYRVVSVSASAAAEWVHVLVVTAAERLEGPASFAGSTTVAWLGRLVEHFAPPDISYASDRLRAQAGRAPERRDELTVRGIGVGRNALLAAHVQIGGQAPLMLFPVNFPVLFAGAMANAAHRAELAIVLSRGKIF